MEISDHGACMAIIEQNDTHRLNADELKTAETGNTYNELLDQFCVGDDDPRREIADKLDNYC